MAGMLLSDRIIIPYLTKEKKPYHLRFSLPKALRGLPGMKEMPKLLGFAGVPVEIYQEANLIKSTFDIVLTEGEFKSVAGIQYGIPTVSIPGISSFSDKHYPRLIQFLKDAKIRKVYILFDNEVKDDPSLPSYKENPHDRYFTQFYSVLMAQKLEASGFEALVAWLPNEWREGGKADIDGALAQGHTVPEMLKLLYDAKPRAEFMKALPKEAGDVVARKMAQYYHRSSVRREFNHYVALRQRGKAVVEEPISNFVMKVVATHHTPEGRVRQVEFHSEGEGQTGPYAIDPEEMSDIKTFRKFLYKHSNCSWKGSIDDLLTVWESEFLLQDEGRVIIESDHIGWLADEKMWLFSNIAVTNDGKEVRPDRSNIFWLEKKGVKPLAFSFGEDKRNGEQGLGVPALNLGSKVDIVEIRKRMAESIGDVQAMIAIGWINAVAYMEEVFSICNSFPFLFVTGQTSSGKSTFCEWIMNFFGVENSGKAISQTTPVAIQRCLSYFSSLPIFLDEYRNSKDIVWKNGFLRNVYNRQSSGKGTKGSYHTVREARVRGTLVIAGEETPKDPAVWSRCITLYISRQKRVQNHYKWFMANKSRFSSHFHSLIVEKPAKRAKFIECFETVKEELLKKEVQDRLAFNYAAIIAGYMVSFGNEDFAPLMESLVKETRTMQEEFQGESAISVFLEDLMALRTRNLVNRDYWRASDGKIYLYFHGLHQVWAEQFKKSRGDEAFKEASIRDYLKEERGFLSANEAVRIGGYLKKCIVFNYDEAPESIRNLVADAEHDHPGEPGEDHERQRQFITGGRPF